MDLKEMAVMIGTAAAGVILGGILINQFYDVPLIKQAHEGFDR